MSGIPLPLFLYGRIPEFYFGLYRACGIGGGGNNTDIFQALYPVHFPKRVNLMDDGEQKNRF